MDVFEAIHRRRSLKANQLKPDPIRDADVMKVLEAARWAPTHGMTEPWRFVVFSTPEAKRKLIEAVVSTIPEDGQPPLPPGDARRQKTEEQMGHVPVVLAIVVDPSSSPKIYEHEEIASVAMAVQNLHLAATAIGLGGYWTSGRKAFHPNIGAFLGLKAPARCLGYFYLGVPDGPLPEGVRRPIEEKVRWFE